MHTQFIYVFCVDVTTTIIFLFNVNSLVFMTQKKCVYCAVRPGT
jgi:hypothetical protein